MSQLDSGYGKTLGTSTYNTEVNNRRIIINLKAPKCHNKRKTVEDWSQPYKEEKSSPPNFKPP